MRGQSARPARRAGGGSAAGTWLRHRSPRGKPPRRCREAEFRLAGVFAGAAMAIFSQTAALQPLQSHRWRGNRLRSACNGSFCADTPAAAPATPPATPIPSPQRLQTRFPYIPHPRTRRHTPFHPPQTLNPPARAISADFPSLRPPRRVHSLAYGSEHRPQTHRGVARSRAA